MPIRARDTSRNPNAGASVPTTPASNRIRMPAWKTRLGPNSVDSLPMVGWAIALHR